MVRMHTAGHLQLDSDCKPLLHVTPHPPSLQLIHTSLPINAKLKQVWPVDPGKYQQGGDCKTIKLKLCSKFRVQVYRAEGNSGSVQQYYYTVNISCGLRVKPAFEFICDCLNNQDTVLSRLIWFLLHLQVYSLFVRQAKVKKMSDREEEQEDGAESVSMKSDFSRKTPPDFSCEPGPSDTK